MRFIAAILFAFPVASYADSRPDSVRVADIISVLGPTWNSNGSFKAALINNGDDADLYIYDSPFDEEPTVYAPAFAWQGHMAGMMPWLEFAENGSLMVYSENMSIGRNRWQQYVTIAKRDGEYVVAGFTYSAYDTLDLDYTLDCDYNVLSGFYLHNGVAKNVPPRRIAVKDWQFEADILDALDCL